MTMRAAPMASGAITPVPAPIPVQPIVRTRKNVPMNSAMYLFIDKLSDFTGSRVSQAHGARTMGPWSYLLAFFGNAICRPPKSKSFPQHVRKRFESPRVGVVDAPHESRR